jgi:hypothetical protein
MNMNIPYIVQVFPSVTTALYSTGSVNSKAHWASIPRSEGGLQVPVNKLASLNAKKLLKMLSMKKLSVFPYKFY